MQRRWDIEQVVKFWRAIQITDPDRNTGKMCLGGGMHCHTVSSFLIFVSGFCAAD